MAEAKSTEIEEWRPVVGYERFYSVSSLGRVRTETKRAWVPKGHILAPNPRRRNYLSVGLQDERERKRHSLHAVVAAAFIGPRPEGMQINHKDGDPRNNRPENLEYCTCLQNIRHSIETGLKPPGPYVRIHQACGERIPWSRLTEREVRQIRGLARAGRGQSEIAREFSVSPSAIRKIIFRRSWKHVADE